MVVPVSPLPNMGDFLQTLTAGYSLENLLNRLKAVKEEVWRIS